MKLQRRNSEFSSASSWVDDACSGEKSESNMKWLHLLRNSSGGAKNSAQAPEWVSKGFACVHLSLRANLRKCERVWLTHCPHVQLRLQQSLVGTWLNGGRCSLAVEHLLQCCSVKASFWFPIILLTVKQVLQLRLWTTGRDDSSCFDW